MSEFETYTQAMDEQNTENSIPEEEQNFEGPRLTRNQKIAMAGGGGAAALAIGFGIKKMIDNHKAKKEEKPKKEKKGKICGIDFHCPVTFRRKESETTEAEPKAVN